MRKSMRNRIVAVVIILVGSAVQIHAQQVDNPQYKSWAAHKVGTSVTLQNDITVQSMVMNNKMTQVLMELTPEKAVVETTMGPEMGGMKQRQEIAAKVEKGQENLPPNVKGTVKEAGRETIDVAGKKVECTVYDFNGQGQSGNVTGKFWRTESVPGGLAKLEMKMEGAAAGTVKTTVTAITPK